MFIYSFKFRWLRVTGWIMLLIFLVAGIYFATYTDETFPKEESGEIWQV